MLPRYNQFMWLRSALVAILSVVASAPMPMSAQPNAQTAVAEFERVVYCGLARLAPCDL